MILVGKKVILRSVEEEDLELLRKSSNSPEFEKMIVGWSFPISKKNQEEWFNNCKNDSSNLRYIIETKDDGAVGMISLSNIDWKNGTAYGKGIRVFEGNRTKGIGTDAWMTLMRYVFNELRLNRIDGSVLDINEISLHLCQKVGFKIEGTKRQAAFKDGKYHDVTVVGCLKSDYEKVVEETNYWGEN